MRFKEDDIVRISKQSNRYNWGNEENPKDTNGKVVDIDERSLWPIRVVWDNGTRNWYVEEDLKLVRRN